MSPSATTSGPHTRRQISMPASEMSVATSTMAAFCNAVLSDDVFGFAAVNALGMRYTISEPGEDHRQELCALGDEKKYHEHRDHDRDRHDPITPAFVQEAKHVVCCQGNRPHLAPRPLRRGAEGESSCPPWPPHRPQ